MPQVDPAEFESLPLEGFRLIRGFPLHDVWLIELEGAGDCAVQDLRRLVTPERLRTLNPMVRALFFLRSTLGRILRLDSTPGDAAAVRLADRLPASLVAASVVVPGNPAGPFRTLYVLHDEAAYQVLNATVHAIVIVAVTRSPSGPRVFWATYVKPVGRITTLYMHLIDPFRRTIVYPGLESWLKGAWLEENRDGGAGRPRAPGAKVGGPTRDGP